MPSLLLTGLMERSRADLALWGRRYPVFHPKPGVVASVQNSNRSWNAIIRGELSPPKPTPSKPVGGDVVEPMAPNPVWEEGRPGMPAITIAGSAKLG